MQLPIIAAVPNCGWQAGLIARLTGFRPSMEIESSKA
jgi:hypothetical protein